MIDPRQLAPIDTSSPAGPTRLLWPFEIRLPGRVASSGHISESLVDPAAAPREERGVSADVSADVVTVCPPGTDHGAKWSGGEMAVKQRDSVTTVAKATDLMTSKP